MVDCNYARDRGCLPLQLLSRRRLFTTATKLWTEAVFHCNYDRNGDYLPLQLRSERRLIATTTTIGTEAVCHFNYARAREMYSVDIVLGYSVW